MEKVLSEILVPEKEWVHASLRKLPPAVIELAQAYQNAVYLIEGAGHKPNRAQALAWVTACALTDGNAIEKIKAMREQYFEQQRAAMAI